jgi:GMP synthase (glutamine-hydrolysing)
MPLCGNEDRTVKIWVLQHHPIENLGTIAAALESAALAWQYVRTYDGHPVPRDMKGAGGLVVMGGPMGVYETRRYPFLRDETALIECALRENKPVLGVCLGSQLLASALGSRVVKGRAKEIGWHRVSLAAGAADDPLFRGLPDSFTALHWHGDVFELPRGAVALASSEMTPVQAFRWGERAYGLLFHLEVTEEQVGAMVREFAGEVKEANADAGEIVASAGRYLASLSPLAESVFGRWARPIQGT